MQIKKYVFLFVFILPTKKEHYLRNNVNKKRKQDILLLYECMCVYECAKPKNRYEIILCFFQF